MTSVLLNFPIRLVTLKKKTVLFKNADNFLKEKQHTQLTGFVIILHMRFEAHR